jgi:hypothetical protein
VSTQTISLIDVRPAANEVAIVPTQPGQGVRLHLPTEGREQVYTPELDDVPHWVVLPGDRERIGWGYTNGWFQSLTGVRNGHHRVNRDAWHAAANAVKGGGIAYVTYTRRDYYGKPRWTANGYRWEPVAELAEVRS